MKVGGRSLELLPHGGHAFRRDRVLFAARRLSADRRKGGALWRNESAIEALVGCSRGQARSRPEAPA